MGDKHNQEMYLNASLRARIILAVYVAFLFVCLFLFMETIEHAKHLTKDTLEQTTVINDFIQKLLMYLLIFIVVHAAIISFLLVRLANASLKLEQFPPSQAWVLRRTKIKKGPKAKKAVYGCYAIAVVNWLPLALPFYLNWLLNQVTKI